MKRRPPPLRAMVIAVSIVLCGLSFLTVSYFLYFRSVERGFRKYNQRRLHSLHESKEIGGREILRVVGLGSSLIRAATFYDKEMDSFSHQVSMPVRYVRMARPGGGPGDWRLVMRDIRKGKPDILVMQSESLFTEPRLMLLHWRGFTKHVTRLFSGSRKELLGCSVKKVRTYITWYETYIRRRNRRKSFRQKVRLRQGWVTPMWDFRISFELKSVLELFRKDGIKIVIIEIPIHKSQRKWRYRGHRKTVQAFLDALKEEGLATVLRCSLKFKHNEFDDDNHMVPVARARYCKWLLKKLARLRANK
jgi:hypothetical protein